MPEGETEGSKNLSAHAYLGSAVPSTVTIPTQSCDRGFAPCGKNCVEWHSCFRNMILRRLRNELIRLLVLAVLVYATILVCVLSTEDAQVFPAAYRSRPDRIPELPTEYQRLTLTTSDGQSLVAQRTHSASQPAQASWCLFFSGQWGRARWDLPKLALFRELGYEVLIFDHRGYGESQGMPSEEGLYRDADAAYRYLTEELRVDPSRIVLVAHSLGTGVAIDLASRSPVGGLILDGAFDSIPALGADQYPWLPLRWFAKNQFASIDKIGRVSAPKLFLHGEFDESISMERARALFAVASEPKCFVPLEGGHEDFPWSDAHGYKTAVTDFVQRIKPDARKAGP
jgi:uncharacterized protein